MRILKGILVTFLLLLWSNSFALNAQVTFGYFLASENKALLNLTHDDGIGIVSNRGILFPILLAKYSNQLPPLLDDPITCAD